MTNDILLKRLIKFVVRDLNRLGCKVKFHKLLFPTGCFGYFLNGHNEIYIDKTQQLLTQYIVLIHEKQHCLCEKNRCFCVNAPTFWGEYHAMKPEEFELLKLCGIKTSIQLASEDVTRYTRMKWFSHLKALRRVMKLKRFRDAAKKESCLCSYNKLIKKMNCVLEK